jgi:hypothetical protein
MAARPFGRENTGNIVPRTKVSRAGELTFWNSIKDSGSCIELEAYLERYPEGEFVELAEARLESLKQTAAGTAASKEEVTEGELTFWNSIKDSANPEMFRAYLNKYPDGTYAELAQINIELEGPSRSSSISEGLFLPACLFACACAPGVLRFLALSC